MKFVSLTLDNIFQHKDLYHEFQPGITGVVGRNGSGKSNFLDALYFAISGKTSSDTAKADMLGWAASSGSTTLVFEHGGRTFTLKRRVDSSAVTLSSPDMEKPLRSKEANAFMEDALGTSFSGMYETCFTPQGGLISILTMGHAQRMAFFQRLVQHSTVERIRAKISDARSKIPLYLDRSEEVGTLSETIKHQTQVREQSAKTIADSEALEEEYRKQLPEVQALLSSPTEDEKSKKVAQAVAQVAYLSKTLADLQSQHTPEPCPPCDPPTEEEENLYRQKDRLDLTSSSLLSASDRLEDLRNQLRQLPTVPSPGDGLFSDKRAIVAKLSAQHDLCVAGVCPTCLRLHDAKDEEKDEAEASLDAARKELEKLSEEWEESNRAFNNNYIKRSGYKAEIASAERQVGHLLESVRTMQESLQGFDKDKYMQKKNAYAKFTQYLQLQARAEAQISPVQRKLDDARDSLLQAEAQVACSEESREKCEEFISNLKELESVRLKAIETKAAADATLAASRERLSAAQEEQSLRNKAEKVSSFLAEARTVLHRDNLPKLVMQKMLVGLNAQLDSYLSLFDTNFTAYISEEFDFMVSFPHKSNVSSRALSGGQMVALALAFKFAAADLLAFRVPLLVLDEPTVWLDDINKPKLASILSKAKSITERTSSEVLIATHEPALMPAFSRIKDVSASGAYAV